MNKADIPHLIADIQSDEAQIRSQAAEILAGCYDERVIEPLIATLENHSNPQVRWAAIYVLRQLGDLRAVEPLITALKDDAESDIRGVAAYTLGQLGDKRAIQPLIAAFSDETNGVRYSATQALAQFGACVARPLLLFLKREDKHSNAVSQVFLLMNDLEAIYPLLATLEDEDSRMRAYAARFLSHFDDPQVIPPLRKAFEDPDSWVRHYAHLSLGLLGHRPPHPP